MYSTFHTPRQCKVLYILYIKAKGTAKGKKKHKLLKRTKIKMVQTVHSA